MIKSITKMGCFVLFLFLAMGSIGLPVFAQQNMRLSGKVTNKKGDALQGVTVRIKGKSQGTSTDAAGKYQLEVAPSSTLVFSQVGMKEQERAVGNQRQLDVTLEDSDNALDEIVVISRELSLPSMLRKSKSVSPLTFSMPYKGRLPGCLLSMTVVGHPERQDLFKCGELRL
jgi:CarboxypepD_reg-like domain